MAAGGEINKTSVHHDEGASTALIDKTRREMISGIPSRKDASGVRHPPALPAPQPQLWLLH